MTNDLTSPRPWKTGTGYTGYETAIIGADGKLVADVETIDHEDTAGQFVPRDRAEANARLIVAAVNGNHERARQLDRSLDRDLESAIRHTVVPNDEAVRQPLDSRAHAGDGDSAHREATGEAVRGPSAPSYTVRPESFQEDMHRIQRDLKR